MPSGSSSRLGYWGSSSARATSFFQLTISGMRSTCTKPSAAVNSLMRKLSPATS